jgi:hypothetical protein
VLSHRESQRVRRPERESPHAGGASDANSCPHRTRQRIGGQAASKDPRVVGLKGDYHAPASFSCPTFPVEVSLPCLLHRYNHNDSTTSIVGARARLALNLTDPASIPESKLHNVPSTGESWQICLVTRRWSNFSSGSCPGCAPTIKAMRHYTGSTERLVNRTKRSRD